MRTVRSLDMNEVPIQIARKRASVTVSSCLGLSDIRPWIAPLQRGATVGGRMLDKPKQLRALVNDRFRVSERCNTSGRMKVRTWHFDAVLVGLFAAAFLWMCACFGRKRTGSVGRASVRLQRRLRCASICGCHCFPDARHRSVRCRRDCWVTRVATRSLSALARCHSGRRPIAYEVRTGDRRCACG